MSDITNNLKVIIDRDTFVHDVTEMLTAINIHGHINHKKKSRRSPVVSKIGEYVATELAEALYCYLLAFQDKAFDQPTRSAVESEAKLSSIRGDVLVKIHNETREKVAKWMIAHGYTTGHGDTVEDLLEEIPWQVEEKAFEKAAHIAEYRVSLTHDRTRDIIAKAIRDLKKETP